MNATRKSVGIYIEGLVTKGWIIKSKQGRNTNNRYDLSPAIRILERIDRASIEESDNDTEDF